MTLIDKEAFEQFLMDAVPRDDICDDCMIEFLHALKKFPGIDIKCDAKGVVHGQLTFSDL